MGLCGGFPGYSGHAVDMQWTYSVGWVLDIISLRGTSCCNLCFSDIIIMFNVVFGIVEVCLDVFVSGMSQAWSCLGTDPKSVYVSQCLIACVMLS